MIIKLIVIILAFTGELSSIKGEQLPEYSEYIRRLGVKRVGTTKPPIQMLASADTVHHWPAISLCKERPADGDYYGHVFCWTMVALFAMSIVSLIIYQLRSILWLRLAISKRNTPTLTPDSIELTPQPQESFISFSHNGQHPVDKHLTF